MESQKQETNQLRQTHDNYLVGVEWTSLKAYLAAVVRAIYETRALVNRRAFNSCILTFDSLM